MLVRLHILGFLRISGSNKTTIAGNIKEHEEI